MERWVRRAGDCSHMRLGVFMSRVHAPVVVQESLSQNQKSRLALILCVLDFPDEDSVRVAGVPLKMRKYN